MSDLNAKIVADLKRELAEARAMHVDASRQLDESLAWQHDIKQRARKAAQAIIERIGSNGPENFDRAVERLLAKFDEARAEIEQQRTRAEAAEQELREQHAAYIAPMSDKLAAIRAHLPALKRLHAWVSSERMGEWTYLEGGTFYDDVQEMAAVVADALEALEP